MAVQCKRCGRELPVGQRKTCPFCGIHLDTYITPRDPNAKPPRKKSSRSTIMSLLSVAFVVIIVSVVIPILRNVNKRAMLAKLDTEYTEMNGREDEYEEGEWEAKLATFSASIHQFKTAYPTDEENARMLERRLNILCGLDPDDPFTITDIDEQKLYNDELIRRARAEMIDFTSVTVGAPSFSGDCALMLTVKNCAADKMIEEIKMALTALDSGGKPIKDGKRGTADGYIRITTLIRPGEEMGFSYLSVWNSTAIDRARVRYFTVYYSDGSHYYFPETVCDALWK
jgi:ribosomal protein L37E